VVLPLSALVKIKLGLSFKNFLVIVIKLLSIGKKDKLLGVKDKRLLIVSNFEIIVRKLLII